MRARPPDAAEAALLAPARHPGVADGSLIATCRAVGVPAQAYLTWAFERLGTHRDVFGLRLEEMTPAAFKNIVG